MKRLFLQLFNKFRHLILYGVIGGISSGLDFLLYTALVELTGLNYMLANCISVLAGIAVSFLLNRKYNFKVEDKTVRRFLIFLSVGLGGLLFSNLILYLCIEYMSIDELVSKVLSIVPVVLLQFLLNKFITFKTDKENG
ncbi:MAG: GtrA family protein [Bacteroidales bacterium]|nr:GtrA family protein [Bacteroidales bacterium]